MGSASRLREDVEDAFASFRCGDPHERQVRVEAPVEVEHKTIGGEKKRQAGAQRVVRMFADVEGDREVAHHGALEAQAEKQAPVRMPPARRKQRPTPRGVNASIVLDDARKIEYVAA